MWYQDIPYNYSTDTEVTDLPFNPHDLRIIDISKVEPCWNLRCTPSLAPGEIHTTWFLLTDKVHTIDSEKVGWCKNDGKLWDDLYAVQGLLVKCYITRDRGTKELVVFPADDHTPRMVRMLKWSGDLLNNYIIHFDMDNEDAKKEQKLWNHFFYFKALLETVGVAFISHGTWRHRQERWKKQAAQELNDHIPLDVARTIVDMVCKTS
jgi:hypothetical protein